MAEPAKSLLNLSPHECRTLLALPQIGRVAFVEAGAPVMSPMTFAVLDDAVVMRTAADTRLAAAASRGPLAFEVDGYDAPARIGWSVLITGAASRVVDPLEQARIRAVLEPWPPGAHVVFLRLPLENMTGRRISLDTRR